MITEVHPTDEPAYTAEEVMDFANRTMIKSLSLNFVNYENQLTSVRGDFSAEGYVSFRKALSDSGLLKDISEKRLNVKLSTTPRNPDHGRSYPWHQNLCPAIPHSGDCSACWAGSGLQTATLRFDGSGTPRQRRRRSTGYSSSTGHSQTPELLRSIMKIKLLTVLMAALFSANSVSAADAPTGNGAPQQTAPAVPGGDIAQWQQASSGLPVNQQSQVQQPPQQTAQEQGQQQAQGQQPQAQAQQRPTTALPPAPMPQIPPPQQQVTHVNPQTLEELPAPVLQQIQPITPRVRCGRLRSAMEDMSAAAKTSPLTPIPRISSQTVSLSAGASIPQVRVFPNQQRQ